MAGQRLADVEFAGFGMPAFLQADLLRRYPVAADSSGRTRPRIEDDGIAL